LPPTGELSILIKTFVETDRRLALGPSLARENPRVNNTPSPLDSEMDRYQLAYLLLVVGLAVTVAYSAKTKEGAPVILEEERLRVVGGSAVRLTYQTGEAVELWMRREEGDLCRLTIVVRAGKGSLVEGLRLNLTGNLSWLALSTMRPLNGHLNVNESRGSYYFDLSGIGSPGLDGLTVDFLIVKPGDVSLDLRADVRRGSSLRHLVVSETLEAPTGP